VRGTIALIAVILLLAGFVARTDTDRWTTAERLTDVVRGWDDRDPTLSVERGDAGPRVLVTAGTASLDDIAAALESGGYAQALVDRGRTWTLAATVVAADGATLVVRDTDLRLAGTAGLHADGGRVMIRRAAVTGWNVEQRMPDTDLRDGRGWVLASGGGVVTADDARLSHLGHDAEHRWGVTVAGQRSRVRLTSSSLTGNFDGLHVTDGGFAQVESSRVRDARRHGIADTGGRRLTIDGANIVGNSAHGVLAERASHVHITGNAIHANHGGGVVARATTGIEIVDNNIYRNPSAGVMVLDGRDVAIRGNLLHSSKVGIAVRGESTAVAINSNRIASNRTDGVWISERSSDVAVGGNRMDFNNEAAIAVKTGAARITGNLLTQNFDGVRLETPAGIAVSGEVRDNEITGNIQDGVDLPAAASLPLVGNVITANREGGISVVAKGDATPAIARNEVRENGRGQERVRETDVAQAGEAR